MNKSTEMSQIAAKTLGSENSYAVYTDKFDPTLLNPMPRSLARKEWGMEGLQFVGYDVWHCHEATFLLNNGLPVAGTLKIIVNANSQFMVESKSFKLYLNSFDMCKMGATHDEAIANYEEQVAKDVSACIGSEVKVHFFLDEPSEFLSQDPARTFVNIRELISPETLESLEITDYSGKETHFKLVETPAEGENTISVYTDVLRSRCRHTKQKDTGTAFFHIKTKNNKKVDLVSLLKEVVALREVNEFHEFCSEKFFNTIVQHPDVEDCMVMLLYARRGSLDINPVRATSENLIPLALTISHIYTVKTMGQ